jgi:hypothetical protein
MSPRGGVREENIVAIHGEESIRFRAEVALATSLKDAAEFDRSRESYHTAM